MAWILPPLARSSMSPSYRLALLRAWAMRTPFSPLVWCRRSVKLEPMFCTDPSFSRVSVLPEQRTVT